MPSSSPSTPRSKECEVLEFSRSLVTLASQQRTHQIALEALLSAYASVAICHPCCAHSAADLARKVAQVIEAHAAPAGTSHVH